MSDKIQMVAGEALHISALGSEPLKAGDTFEVDSEADALRLEAAGHKRAKKTAEATASAPAKASARKSRKVA